jgi:hypothetical protein
LVLLALCIFTFGAFADNSAREQEEDIYHDLEIFAKIVEKVKAYYVDDVNAHEIIGKAIEGKL